MLTLDRTKARITSPRHAWLLATLALAFACPSDDTVTGDGTGTGNTSVSTSTSAVTSTNGITSTSGASGSSSGTSGSSSGATDPTAADSTGDAPPQGACICVWPNELGFGCDAEALAAWVPDCPEAQPCPRLTVECSRPAPDLYSCKAELAYDEAAMQCMLEVLRDGTPARLEIDGLEDGGFLSGQSLYLVHVLPPEAGDRLALRTGCRQTDLGAEPYGPEPFVLADSGYFTACMDVAVPSERYDCMMNGLLEGTCEAAQVDHSARSAR